MTSTTEEKIFDKALGDRLRKIRILKGYSQKDLSKEINVTFQQLQKYETGSNRISISRLFSIAKILNIEISTLINNEVEVINENHETLKMLISKNISKINDLRTQKSILLLVKNIVKNQSE